MSVSFARTGARVHHGKSCGRTSARLKQIPLRFGVTGEISAEICGTVDATCEICVWIVETRADIRSVLRVSRFRDERDWSSNPEGLKSGQQSGHAWWDER